MSHDILVLTGEPVRDVQLLIDALMFKALKLERTEGNSETPHRIMKMLLDELMINRAVTLENEWVELTRAKLTKCFTTSSTALVVVDDIEVKSICEHHWMPFLGKCRVTYKPNGKVIGLSKIPRIVEFYSKKPQLQETLTEDIFRAIKLITESEYVKVELYDVTHLCVEMRGIKKNCKTSTVLESGKD